MNEGYSERAKATSKSRHEVRKISKLMDRRSAAVKAGADETALKISNKLHNYSTEGGNRNPKIAKLNNSTAYERVFGLLLSEIASNVPNPNKGDGSGKSDASVQDIMSGKVKGTFVGTSKPKPKGLLAKAKEALKKFMGGK